MATGPTPFRGSTSGLTRDGLARHLRVLRGVYVEPVPDLEDEARFEVRCDAALVAVPDGRFDRRTAGRLWRLPVDPRDDVSLTRPPEAHVTEHPGITTRRAVLHPDDVDECRGRPVTSLPRTFVDLAATSSLPELVAVGDVVAKRVGVAVIQAAVSRAVRRKGVVLARAALPLIDPGAGSPAETRTRLVLHAAGFTKLRHAVVLRDEHGGWIGEADLGDEGAMVAVQYDGAVHVDPELGEWVQQPHDVNRDELARMAGWEVVLLTKKDLHDPELMIAKVTRAYERAEHRRRGRLLPAADLVSTLPAVGL